VRKEAIKTKQAIADKFMEWKNKCEKMKEYYEATKVK
jgi:hypothetical protein